MPFVKVVKNKAYFKRFQVKYRRRREGKTDYQARRSLVVQDKNKYNSPKYRLVVRITNSDVITQVVHSKIVGDFVLSAAYAHELPKFGIPVGLTNYSAAYATGLLLARRVLTKLGLADKYAGNGNVDGSDYNVSALADGPRPFRVILDVGLARTSTGAKIFAALKGVTDGGLECPHSVSRFAGYDAEKKTLDVAVLRKYIFGGHVADYMRSLKESDESAYKARFSQFIKSKINADGLEAMYANAHKAIRANPAFKKVEKPAPKEHKPVRARRLNSHQRYENVQKKKAELAKNKTSKRKH
eukprot:TRINITY_DN130_c0_g1_i1.p1 TRINITY_DN130_c0_g1~~TRINITY_DN130_c0_g1_i1.p1  ORF type:complete len:308 (-),score=110.15 TRINITY_DN130_c0_g1_i1:72-968(-)